MSSEQEREGIWKPGANYTWLYVDATGEVLGEVTGSMGRGTNYAIARQKHIGEFYTEHEAQAAVVAALLAGKVTQDSVDSVEGNGTLPDAADPFDWQWIPKRADEALLRPFYNCPPEELPLAWQAMLRVAEVKLDRFLDKEASLVTGRADNAEDLIAQLRASDSVKGQAEADAQKPAAVVEVGVPAEPTDRESVMWRLHRFLDVAGGEGLDLGGVDAADLFCDIFEDGAI